MENKDKTQLSEKKLNDSTNTIKAFLFALLIMIGGAILWGLVYSVGFFSSWIAFLPSFGAIMLYKKFKPDGKSGMLCYVLLLSLLFNYVSMILSLSLSLLIINDGYTFGELLVYAFEYSITIGITDTTCCIGFTALGVGLGYVSAVKSLQKPNMKNSNMNMPNQNPINPNMVMPNQNGSVSEAVPTINVKPKSEQMLDEITSYVEMLEKNLIEKSELLNLIEKYKTDKISILNDQEKTELILSYSKPLEDKNREIARKILVKLLVK